MPKEEPILGRIELKFSLLIWLCLAFALLLITAVSAHADQEVIYEKEIEDARRGSIVVQKKANFIPVPIPVSNPTVGSGLQGVLLYLHPQRAGDTESPNATSGLVGMYTNTQSWLAGIFHDNYWANDKYRFTGFIGYGGFNLKYYGIGETPILKNNPIDYEIKGLAFMPQFQVRIPKTEHWFGGAQYLFIDADITFKIPWFPDLPDIRGNVRTAGLGLLTTYDSRDDNYYPSMGQYFQARLTNYSETWGGDYRYIKFKSSFTHYQPIKEKTLLAFRAILQTSEGDIPFFDLPYLDMRGFSRGRYQDQHTFSLHAEARRKFHPRWGLIAFLESGWFGDSLDNMKDNPTVISYGGGIRWQVIKDKKLNLGADIAFSEDGAAFYIQVGEKF